MTKVTFLFWNLRKKALEQQICVLTSKHKIDMLVFAECRIAPADMVRMLEKETSWKFTHLPDRDCEKIVIYSRFSGHELRNIASEKDISINSLQLQGKDEIILAAAHLLSKMDSSPVTQAFTSRRIAQLIREQEDRRPSKHRRTLLVGDLNMNPYDTGMISADGLNAVLARHLAVENGRLFDRKRYPVFFNPMWRHFGDAKEGPPGSYYYTPSIIDRTCWHILDQVLVRPELIDRFMEDDLQILTGDGACNFITKTGALNKKDYSDHLPLLFRLDL